MNVSKFADKESWKSNSCFWIETQVHYFINNGPDDADRFWPLFWIAIGMILLKGNYKLQQISLI